MEKKNPYIELAECLLPEELVEYFEVVKVDKTAETLDVTLAERDKGILASPKIGCVPMAFMRKA